MRSHKQDWVCWKVRAFVHQDQLEHLYKVIADTARDLVVETQCTMAGSNLTRPYSIGLTISPPCPTLPLKSTY